MRNVNKFLGLQNLKVGNLFGLVCYFSRQVMEIQETDFAIHTV